MNLKEEAERLRNTYLTGMYRICEGLPDKDSKIGYLIQCQRVAIACYFLAEADVVELDKAINQLPKDETPNLRS